MKPAPYPEFDGTQRCYGEDTELWYRSEDADAARAICRRCVWLIPCRDYALTNTELGVWGGLTEQTRRRIQRHRNIVPSPAPHIGHAPTRAVNTA